jgi:hypothetical protein
MGERPPAGPDLPLMSQMLGAAAPLGPIATKPAAVGTEYHWYIAAH